MSTNIERLARGSRALFIWTDCDREGEYIGSEVRQEALKGNNRLEIKRARFSNIERAYVHPSVLKALTHIIQTCHPGGKESNRSR